MRSIIIVIAIALFCGQQAYAQKTYPVPGNIKEKFAKAYPGATNVKWEDENNQYEVTFQYQSHEMSILYSGNGVVNETETLIPVSELPKPAAKYASAKGKIKEASRIVKADGSVQYEAEVNKKDLMFDEKGNFISEKQEHDEKD